MAGQGTRYEPYTIKSPARRRGSDSWRIRSGIHHSPHTCDMLDLFEDINTRCGSREMREIFRDHANQPDALCDALVTWVRYDEVATLLPSSSLWAAQTGVLLADSLFQIRGPRQPELANVLETQDNRQTPCSYAPESIAGSAGVPPTTVSLDRVCLAVIGRLNVVVHSQESSLLHSPQAPRSNYTRSGETLFANPTNSPCTSTVPTPATSPYSNSSPYRPSFIPRAGDLCEDIQPYGEEQNYLGEYLVSLAASHPPEGPHLHRPTIRPVEEWAMRSRCPSKSGAVQRLRRWFLYHRPRCTGAQTGTLHLI